MGDAGGLQSPLSFGGFGALCRHIERVTAGVDRALATDSLAAVRVSWPWSRGELGLTRRARLQEELAWLQPYMPNLVAPWLFQKSMSVPIGGSARPNEINDVLNINFRVMEKLGAEVLLSFLQDVPQFRPLLATILGMMVEAPLAMPGIIMKMGPVAILTLTWHMTMMATFSVLDVAVGPAIRKLCEENVLGGRVAHRALCAADAWRFGSGHDYSLE